MKVKTSDLTGAALDWAVAKCEGCSDSRLNNVGMWCHVRQQGAFRFSTDWSQGGPIIEREGIDLASPNPVYGGWCAMLWSKPQAKRSGTTPLLAAMRCYVASKLGDTVEIPEELGA